MVNNLIFRWPKPVCLHGFGGSWYIYIYTQKIYTQDPWDWYIYLHEWLIFVVHVSRYTSPMDPIGYIPGTEMNLFLVGRRPCFGGLTSKK